MNRVLRMLVSLGLATLAQVATVEVQARGVALPSFMLRTYYGDHAPLYTGRHREARQRGASQARGRPRLRNLATPAQMAPATPPPIEPSRPTSLPTEVTPSLLAVAPAIPPKASAPPATLPSASHASATLAQAKPPLPALEQPALAQASSVRPATSPARVPASIPSAAQPSAKATKEKPVRIEGAKSARGGGPNQLAALPAGKPFAVASPINVSACKRFVAAAGILVDVPCEK
jgi:hypothetical protein